MKNREPESTFETSTGLQVEIYRLQPDDAGYLVDLFEHMSADSRYLRFNQYLANPDPDMVWREAEHLSVLDPSRGMGFLAFADLPDQPHAPVAGARFVCSDDPECAEVSVAVRDDLQHQGIGAHLLLYLSTEAHKAGVHYLVGTFHTNNRRIWALLAESPFLSKTVVEGVQTTVTIDLQTMRNAAAQDTTLQSANS